VRVPPEKLSARVERFYVAAISFSLGAGGMALGFLFGVIPYFHVHNVGRYDGFFATCVGMGALAGFLIGVVNGARWYRSGDMSPLAARRMLAYLYRRSVDGRGVPQRTLNSTTLRALLGSSRARRG